MICATLVQKKWKVDTATNQIMNPSHELIVLKMLIKTYLSEEIQNNETPKGALKRMELRNALLAMATKEE